MNEGAKTSAASGIVIGDPAATMPVGSEMRFQAVPIQPKFAGPAASISNWEFFEGMLLAIAFGDRAGHRVEGSAVLVAPGVALCATHVIEPHVLRLLAAEAGAVCVGVTSHGLQIWRFRKITHVPNTDLTILGLELASALPPHNTFFQAAISTRTPVEGEELLICGFRAPQAVEDARGIEIRGELRLSKGPVSARYPRGRDRAMIPWPSVEVACPALGGMSGGPIFDSNGLLIGLLCSSMDFAEGGGTSNISMIWPALATTIECVWPGGLIRSPTTLTEMGSQICSIDKPEAVVRAPNAEGGGYQTAYHVWER